MRIVLRRLGATIPVMLVVAVVVFLMLHLSAGDPAAIIAGDNATEEDIALLRKSLGLDRPLAEQFVQWIWQLAQGDLGVSIFNRVPVATMIAQRMEPTIALTVLTMTLAVSLAVPLGVLAAWRVGTWVDHTIMALAVAAFSCPVFLIGYALVQQFARTWKVLPVQGYTPLSEGLVPFLLHLALPAISLGLIYTALLARMTRSTMLEVLGEDYIRTARAKGLGVRQVLLQHGLRNAAVPIVTTIGLGIALLIGGVVVAESVFAIPGIGRLTVEALQQRDYPVIQGVILVSSLAYVLVNLLIDLSYLLLDPRIRY
ncbi:MAG: ABC transporter permease [Alphaproteobacteria bacterium]|nr:ABC transporter permease [Alphaproteobacteria bacterium]